MQECKMCLIKCYDSLISNFELVNTRQVAFISIITLSPMNTFWETSTEGDILIESG